MALKIFLSKTPKLASSDLHRTHVSESYASTGLINWPCVTDTNNTDNQLDATITV